MNAARRALPIVTAVALVAGPASVLSSTPAAAAGRATHSSARVAVATRPAARQRDGSPASARVGHYVARFVDLAGHPLRGVDVTVTEGVIGPSRHAVSGADGRVDVASPTGEVEVTAGGQHITGGSTDSTGYVGIDRFVAVQAGRSTNAGTIALRPGGALRIRALDQSGNPIAGLAPSLIPVEGTVEATPYSEQGDELFAFAFVFVDNPTPTADRTSSDGSVVVRGVPAGVAVQACAGAVDTQAGTSSATYRSACVSTAAVARTGRIRSAGTLTLAPAAGAVLAGRLTRPDGTGFAGVQLDVRHGQDGYADVTTGRDGRFRLGGQPPGTYHVCADFGSFSYDGATGYLPGCTTVRVPASGTVPANLTLQRGAAVSGRVRGPGHAAVADATVQTPHGLTNTVTDAHGHYLLKGLPAGAGSLCVLPANGSADGSLPYGLRETCGHHRVRFVARRSQVRTGVEITLQPGATVAGTVLDTRGRRVPHALVFAEQRDGIGSSYDEIDATSGRKGGFVLRGLTAGRFSICAVVPALDGAAGVRCGSTVRTRIKHHVRGVAVRLPATSTIDVQAVDTQGRAVSGVDAVALTRCSQFCDYFPSLGRSATAAASAVTRSGRVTLDNLLPGRYEVCAFDYFATSGPSTPTTGYGDTCTGRTFHLTVRVDRPTRLRLVLPEAGEVTGTVTDSAGAPLAGVIVHVARSAADDVPQDDDDFGDPGEPGEPNSYSVTAADGSYTIRSVLPGSRLVCFDPSAATGGSSHGGYQPQCAGGAVGSGSKGTPVTVTAGSAATVDMPLASGGALAGTVSFGKHPSIEFVGISLFRDGKQVDDDDGLDSPGSYEFDQLPTGDYVVCAEFAGPQVDAYRCYDGVTWNPQKTGGRPPSNATPVSVVPGAITRGIDLAYPH